MPSTALLKASFEILHATRMTRALAPWTRGLGLIFCLHRVIPNGGKSEGFAPNHQLEISPAFLDAALSHIKARGYRLLSMADAVAELNAPTPQRQPFAVFTLDDGYRDNLVHAAPLFRKHQIPYTIYVAPGLVEATCDLWWLALERMIASREELAVGINGENRLVKTKTDAEKHQAWDMLFPHAKNLPEHEQRQWIRNLAATCNLDLAEQCRTLVMDWHEIRDIAKDKLCTIGAHTLNHFALRRLPQTEALREMKSSAEIIADKLQKPVRHFAYPYGDVAEAGPREFGLAIEAGFATAVVTRKGVLYPGHAAHLHALPRVMLSGRYQKIRYLDALLSGAPLALLNRFRHLDVN